MLCCLVKQETFNFNNFISTKYIALYFMNIHEGIFVELQDKIILNILSKGVVIYSKKKKSQSLLKPRMWVFKFLPGSQSMARGQGHHCGGISSSCLTATRDALWSNQQEHGTLCGGRWVGVWFFHLSNVSCMQNFPLIQASMDLADQLCLTGAWMIKWPVFSEEFQATLLLDGNAVSDIMLRYARYI